ncbi:MAG: hypothetical protein L0Y37_02020 [Bacteroidales bacterium]|nr:hypothetical protein [Bacteroidales bacterium]
MDTTYLSYRLRFIWLTVFAVAMGFLEAIVVVYLRMIYYPEGFDFPLALIPPEVLSIEWVREIATLVMLAGIGIIAGRNNLQRLFYALFAFGVWDIFYYVALKLFLAWPASILTWDLLFLIPIPWLGPVLAPVICSVTMIIMALLIIGKQERGFIVNPSHADWILIYGGAAIILYTFLIDYSRLIIDSGVLSSASTPDDAEQLLSMIKQYIPGRYKWLIFIAGELLIISGTVRILLKTRKKDTIENVG